MGLQEFKEEKLYEDGIIMGRRKNSLLKILSMHLVFFPAGAGYFLAREKMKHRVFLILFWIPLVAAFLFQQMVIPLIVFYAILFMATMLDLWRGVKGRNTDVEASILVERHARRAEAELKRPDRRP